ncbi:radical SAM protein [Engelhardtia mirabilis]|uniref:S-adenosyl-L-methionine-dependent 2-deoxy-scyllo-inosamine dehydrogenase n=1 Tax=Engelhardtia mirabilis TaxID=2528011 RepID=A0A518BLX4_9BACT|nr:S-adenosyl-L-methionine-dependent 2-deoxy-scyllo-inosamine dehydrogenase [Planctomycetes bacterium Pla133]QDV02272.1 S-adenosyl-L-methionine-dependent 2-deoxy-scyllo-inosamine dehydrogenase [Planctomycetes bacterium Pla86]
MEDRDTTSPSSQELPLHPSQDQPALGGSPSELDLPPHLVGASQEAIWEWVRETGTNPLPVRALQIETTSICNFRCQSCPLSLDGYDRPTEHLCLAEFNRILDAFPGVEKVELQGLGEVFLNPELFALVRAARERGIEVHTYSNASKVTAEAAFGLIESGLALINFSMDGADAETFRSLRKGGQLRVYKRCVSNLLAARRALGSTTPSIGVMSVLSKRNLKQVPELLAIAEELGVDAITFTKLNGSHVAGQEVLELDEADREWLRSLPPYDGPLQVHWGFEPWTKEQRMDCYWPRHMAYVTVEGDVTPCCNFFDSRELNLGNVHEKTGREIWNDVPYRQFRKDLLAGDLHEKCKRC